MKNQSTEDIAKLLKGTRNVIILVTKEGKIDIVTNMGHDDDEITDAIIYALSLYRKDLRARKTGPNVN